MSATFITSGIAREAMRDPSISKCYLPWAEYEALRRELDSMTQYRDGAETISNIRVSGVYVERYPPFPIFSGDVRYVRDPTQRVVHLI